MKPDVKTLKTVLLVVAALSASSLTTPAQNAAQPVSASASSGPTVDVNNYDFQADLFTGRFTYKVPIIVAPGRQGSAPNIALEYNSAAGNGWCGVGWVLDVGYIQRDTRKGVPVLWGSTGPLPQYDDSQGFIADIGGAMSTLVRVGPTNQNPIVYRAHVDKVFLLFNYYTNNYWQVVDKSGNSLFFGEGITNQMENNKTNWTSGVGSSTFRWALDRTVDANGNEAFFNYSTDRGALYLQNIKYNANTNSPTLTSTHEVDFVLTTRPDTNVSFLSNFRVTVAKLLSEIDIKVSGTNVRKYTLTYTQSPSTTRSLLASVTEYGSDFTSALPSIKFGYQVEAFQFGAATNWAPVNTQGDDTLGWWGSPAANDNVGVNSGTTYMTLQDINADGLPDRVVVQNVPGPATNLMVQLNTGSGFGSNIAWGPLQTPYIDNYWNSITATAMSNSPIADNYVDLVDMNGDGLPDRVTRSVSGPYTNFLVQFNTGSNFATATNWGPVNSQGYESYESWGSLAESFSQSDYVVLQDINGDGLPDRIMRKADDPTTNWVVQLNTGSGFGASMFWGPLQSPENNDYWNCINATATASLGGNQGVYHTYVEFIDINGDGLPDRVMRSYSGPYTNFVVQFNNGGGFEPAENWGPVNSQGNEGDFWWGCPTATYNVGVTDGMFTDGEYQNTYISLQDINGDGLPDRIMASASSPYTNWVVQLNTGSGFGSNIIWGPLQSPVTNEYWNSIDSAYDYSDGSGTETFVQLIDINGDGLSDRVMRNAASPYTGFVVQLNQSPFPDLLNAVSNGIGGSIAVSYAASTTLNNNASAAGTPGSQGSVGLLPFNEWVVSQIVSSDGMGNSSTNAYAFQGGYYNAAEREFRGFSQSTVTDPLGTQTTTYFHQSGGRDNTALGEYIDQGSESKKGIPFRIDVVGNDGKTNRITLNKVEEVLLGSNGWYFPFISQTTTMDYEGLTNYRAIAVQFSYDTNTENLLEEADLGEVTNIVVNGQTFTDVANDSIFKWTSYTNIGSIVDRPSDTKITSDSAGTTRLRENVNVYDGDGNLKLSQSWLNTSNSFITTVSNNYDQYGNLFQATDAAGITTTITLDPTYKQYPIIKITGSFSSSSGFDARSGLVVSSTDIKGQTSSNVYDVFFRPTAAYVSTNAYGAPTLWQTMTSYSQAGISNGLSYNYILNQVNNGVDPINGFITYTYADGLGRTIESRAESETGQYRVANSVYDLRGKPVFATLAYFSSGTGYTAPSGTYLGTSTGYDAIGRAYSSTPAVNGLFASGRLTNTTPTGGDAGSPVNATTTAFLDGSNPWATVVTDPLGKMTKSYLDANGRTVTNSQVTTNGNVNTVYMYDLLGDLTNLIDNANNTTLMSYDSLGRNTSMADPDMGTWTYIYDNDSRLVQQTDAKNNTITCFYSDPLGRLTSKHIFDASNAIVRTVTYVYDSSPDTNYVVYPGQLYKVTDLQGYERFSYDVRGRVLKDARLLAANAIEYVTTVSYDDADRIQQLTYPGNSAIIAYSYDTAGHVSQIKSLAGTGTTETFYTPAGFNALNQPTGCTYGNGVVTAYSYYGNSSRLQNITTGLNGTNYQNLGYSYDASSDIASINDGVYSGAASASVSSITYDDLYRVTSLNSTARGAKTYGYNSIGNTLTNQDFGPGLYQYGSKPHAVTNANGIAYGYDPCGNMISRGSQSLSYDAQNQLTQVATTNDAVTFGYDDNGERLWRVGTNGYTIWINGIYEINNGKVLCHILAGGQLIATFEPQCTAGLSKVFGERNWYVASTWIQQFMDWPFQEGRAPLTVMLGMLTAILAICLLAQRKCAFGHRIIRSAWRPMALWRQGITFTTIIAMLMAQVPKAEAATYNPVFYYYHPDHLGSTSVMTDRSGQLVQHYEYATFGQTSYQSTSSAFPVSNRYTGQIADDETGLYYYGGRYYDPQLGRFIQPDPEVPDSSDSQSLNRYSYCRNNPINAVDPTGLEDVGQGSVTATALGEEFGDLGNMLGTAYDFVQSISFQQTITYNDGYDFLGGGSVSSSLAFSLDNASFSFKSFASIPSFSPVQGSQFGSALLPSNLSDILNYEHPTQPSPVEPHAATPAVGGGWLSTATNIAGWLSMIPGPFGALAGGIDAIGELAQGHLWAAAAAGVTSLAAIGGFGFVVKIAKEAKAASEAARAAEELPQLEISASKYRDLTENILHAQKAGHPQVLTAGGDIAANRAAALEGVPKISGLTRDEYPFASSMEGGKGAWVGHIPGSQQNAQGALIKNLTKANKITPGMKYKVVVVP